jgi:hypothetical protein
MLQRPPKKENVQPNYCPSESFHFQLSFRNFNLSFLSTFYFISFKSTSLVPILLVKKNLANRYLADGYLADGYLADSYLADGYLADRYLSDRYLADRYLVDRV